MIGLTLQGNLQRWSGQRRLPLYRQRASYRLSDIGQQSSNHHADWYDQYSYSLLSLLTCFPPTSSLPIIAGVQEPSATLSPSASHAAFPSPVLPPAFPCAETTPVPAQEPVLFPILPHRSTPLAEHFFDGPEHHAHSRRLICAFPPRAGRRCHQREPRRRLRLDHPHQCHPPSACRATAGHRSPV